MNFKPETIAKKSKALAKKYRSKQHVDVNEKLEVIRKEKLDKEMEEVTL